MSSTEIISLAPREAVLAVYPKAFSESIGPSFQIVVPTKYGSVVRVGYSTRNVKDAWRDAAHSLWPQNERYL